LIMKGDFVTKNTVIADCGSAARRQAFIDRPKIATEKKAATAEWNKETQRFCDWLTDDCGRVI